MSNIPDWETETPKFEGERVRADAILGKPLIVHDFATFPSKFHKGENYVIVQLEFDGKKYVWMTAGKTVIKQLEGAKAKGHLPRRAMLVRRQGRSGIAYYCFEKPKIVEQEKLK
jgi:hypothetical protein